ncbi:DUF742 domain-containing protein (plasmid) [Streptomyces sp. BB1-1-1]|uniref:DUF742 domain-containing protein n=1 Tax=Streptomyces sp. BB1-1-1 TaxID=3074430 RepID=UPI002877D3C1|nr:DUF742 domain-containing protein [Streptomyces sp. BB1-1-1]WND40708.1 DUF742 domain-containing protein [Streptomyces sp. BB1-1-1]
MAPHRGVRPFTWTAPRLAAPSAEDGRRITMQTLIRTTAPPDRLASVPEKWQTVLRLADRPTGIAVAEIAANLRIKLTPTAALVAELENRALVTHQGLVGDNGPDTELLLRIRTGLENL